MLRECRPWLPPCGPFHRSAEATSRAGIALALLFLSACADPVFAGPDSAGLADTSEDDAAMSPPDPDEEAGAGLGPDASTAADAGGSADAGLDTEGPHDSDTPDDVPLGGGEPRDAQVTSDSSLPASDAGAPTTDASAPTTDASAPVTALELSIAGDQDDGAWIMEEGVLEERTHLNPVDHNTAGNVISVSTDDGLNRLGLRFALPLERGAQIVSATLTLMRVGQEDFANATDTMLVRVFDSDSVAAFSDAHRHKSPSEHAPEGLWPQAIGGFAVGVSGSRTTSPDLSVLVQHVIDRPGWTRGAYIGFVVSPEQMAPFTFAQYVDSFDAPAPKLSLRYRPSR
jgi:hypothetical protein